MNYFRMYNVFAISGVVVAGNKKGIYSKHADGRARRQIRQTPRAGGKADCTHRSLNKHLVAGKLKL